MYALEEIGKALFGIIKWFAIIATSILAPTISVWAIIKFVKRLIQNITRR